MTLTHELQHTKLNAVMYLFELLEPVAGERFYAPWRDDPRPLGGFLQGIYAFFGIAEESLGYRNTSLLGRLAAKPNGQIGETLNSTYWAVLALGGAPRATTRFVLAHQAKSGGFAWGSSRRTCTGTR